MIHFPQSLVIIFRSEIDALLDVCMTALDTKLDTIICVGMQRDRQEQIEEKKALKRQERELARRHEFVRRCRIAVEEKHLKVQCPATDHLL